MMNIYHLKSFYICALHKNASKAAQALGVSQPSVSQQIKAFEDELGFQLFYRSGRSLDLTLEGKMLFQKSKAIFDSIKSVEDFLEYRGKISEKVSLYASEDIEKPFLSKIAVELMKNSSFQNTSFSVNTIANFEKPNSKKSNEDEFFLSLKKQKTMELVHEFAFPVKLISKTQNIDLGHAQPNNLMSLLSRLGQKLLVPNKGHILRAELDKQVDLEKLNDHILLESNVLACLTQALREGIGCSLLPVQYVYDDIKKNRLSVYGPPRGFWEHRLYLFAPRNYSKSAAEELIRIIQTFSIEKGG